MEAKQRPRHGGERRPPPATDGGEEYDPWTAWLYKPRTISVLLVGACLLIWASGALDPEGTAAHSSVTSIKRGVWAMIAVFLAYCTLQAPSTILIRPHPAVWRLVHGLAVVYLVALTFLLFQNRDDARQFMKHLHPDLGVELPERSYGADCRLYVPENPKNKFINIYETLFDEFVVAHILGWWGKAVMIRNQLLLWVLSIGFELMELTFRHMLPNFNECWWDSIILDILICNWFGIWAGMHTVRHFDGKTYEWVGLSRQRSIMGKVKRSLSQFTPAQWDKDQWHPFMGPLRFIQVLFLCVVFMTVELNTFFLKFCLWIPPRNPLVVYRLILWWLIAIPTIREYNSYLQDRKPVKKVGAFCWLSLAICIVELLICMKFGHAGMLWSGDLPDVETLKENIVAYFNILQGFLLVCHGSMVGAGPTLHKSIFGSAKDVVDSSFSLFKHAVSAYESRSSDRNTTIPQVTGTVWEACAALKKVPASNCIAIGRAMTRIGVCLKDVLREMNELPIGGSGDSTAEKSSNGVVDTTSCSDRDERSDLDLDDDDDDEFTEEEVAVAKLVINVVSDSLVVVKEAIRFITGLLRSSGNKDKDGANEDRVEPMEKLLSHCKEIADQVNDLGASVYPPQDSSEMELAIKRLYNGINGMRKEIGNLGGAPESTFAALEGFENCLGSLRARLADDVVNEMEGLNISH
ncbi:CDP-diacylglycerol--serine O-phosphatidyltransferase 2 [Zea mays]|uniref:CDP-diacylglycerol--serine O-phosphatidyltransferase n=1 Tax=Zea mays TaxID=4577 RepID=A0A3L6ECK5_MAIZE|nr:CDP-diacylglycerol--serine O-phosphatidyltransferase 2 [Zea mays]